MREEEIRCGLATRVVGRRVLCLEKTGSTSDVVWNLAVEGEPEGLVVLAEEQTRGRGRLGRTWFAPAGSCILASVLLRPELPVERVCLMTAAGALAVADALEEIVGLRAAIRFPNDVLVGDRKICGILVESRLVSSRPDFFVMGIGLNVNVPSEALPPELRGEATSVLIETGRETDRARLARGILEALDRWYGRLVSEPEEIPARWKRRSAIQGRRVEVREGSRVLRGRVEEEDLAAGLSLRTEDGMLRAIRPEHIESLRLLP